MKMDEIKINDLGFSVLGFLLGFRPTVADLQLALEGETLRNTPTTSNHRQLWICDSKGLSWLADCEDTGIAWVDIVLGPLAHRRPSDADPKGIFQGTLRIGKYTVRGTFSVETGELIRNVVIPGVTIDLSAARNRVRAVTIGFPQNEPS
jgi:hypothetical protein